jgi:hypothetical protein
MHIKQINKTVMESFKDNRTLSQVNSQENLLLNLGRCHIQEYNPCVLKPRQLPDLNQLSIIAAIILLAYALARFVNLPAREIALQLPGIYLSASINIRTTVALLSASVTATGADWLLRGHPEISRSRTFEHWLLPALTAWVIGIPLFQLPLGLIWWLGFFIGGAILTSVLVAEYITVDPDDIRHSIAAAGLTALSFALYLTLAISLRLAGFRLYLILPAITFAAGLVSLRTLNLRLYGQWAFTQAGVIAIISAQIVAALHYLPLSPISYGLLILGPTYALTSFLANLTEGEPIRQAIIEPGLVFALILVVAMWIR